MGKNIWTEYECMELPDVLSFIVDNRGKTVPLDENGKHKLIATNCIKNENLYPVYEKVRYLNEDTYENWFRAHPIPGDIIFVNKGTPGKVCLVPDPVDFCIAQDMMAFRVNDDIIYNKYLFAVLRSERIQGQIAATSVGDVIPHYKKQHLKEIKIPIPPMDIQVAIGDAYFMLCQKQEINNRIVNILEQQAKALYKSWFIDFENNGYKMPPNYRKGIVDEVIELHDSKRKPLSGKVREKLDKIYPYYGASSVMDYVDDYIFDGTYLLLGEDGSVIDENGYPILQYVFGKFWANNHAHVITGKAGFSVEMLYLLFSSTHVNDAITGAVQLKISQQNLKRIEIVIPNEDDLNEFETIIQPIFQKIKKVKNENSKLIQMRDSFIPKLMTGILDVEELIG